MTASPRSPARSGYVVFLAAMGVCAKLRGIETKPIMGIPSIETGVFGGIIVGLIAAAAFNRFYRDPAAELSRLLRRQTLRADHHRVRRHRWRARCSASSGRRSATRIEGFSHWAVHGRPALAFTIYGVVERALIPFGLHHVWNVPFFFQAGDLHRSRHRRGRARRNRALHRRRSDRGQHDRRLPVQDVGPARRGARDVARARARNSARRSAAS